METRFVDSADGTKLRVVRWGDAGRDVLCIGGLAEHAGRYDHVANAFVAAGWRFTVVEMRGHGHSGGRRSHVFRWSEYVDDVKAVLPLMEGDWVMLSHSMGGLIACESLNAGVKPAKLVLSNPLLALKLTVPPVKAAAGKVLSKVWPTLALANEVKGEALSRDPAVGIAYNADPLICHKVTGRWFTEMLAAQTRAMAANYSVPMAFFLGSADPVNDPAASKTLAAKKNSFVKVYPDMRHEIFNEIGKEGVIADVVAWVAG